MIIKKYFHSTIQLEENGKRLLFDPGTFTFGDGGFTVGDIETPDVIIITHSHQDHFDVEHVKELLATSSAVVITNPEIQEVLKAEGVDSQVIQPGQTTEVAGFTIQAINAPHEHLPFATPANYAYVTNNRVLHVGDSYSLEAIPQVEVLCLPIVAPWTDVNRTFEFAGKVKPKIAIPIHDGFVKQFMLDRVYYGVGQAAAEKFGFEFKPLAKGESFEIQ